MKKNIFGISFFLAFNAMACDSMRPSEIEKEFPATLSIIREEISFVDYAFSQSEKAIANDDLLRTALWEAYAKVHMDKHDMYVRAVRQALGI